MLLRWPNLNSKQENQQSTSQIESTLSTKAPTSIIVRPCWGVHTRTAFKTQNRQSAKKLEVVPLQHWSIPSGELTIGPSGSTLPPSLCCSKSVFEPNKGPTNLHTTRTKKFNPEAVHSPSLYRDGIIPSGEMTIGPSGSDLPSCLMLLRNARVVADCEIARALRYINSYPFSCKRGTGFSSARKTNPRLRA
jgi:hypothetical protein